MPVNETRRSIYESRPVFDWNNFELGTCTETEFDTKTHEAKSLTVTLSREAEARVGRSRLNVPVDFVFGIRKDEVMLDRSIDELSGSEADVRRPEIALAAR